MSRKRLIALLMALTMLFTLMTPAFALAAGGEDEATGSDTSEVTGEPNEQPPVTDPDEGGDEANAEEETVPAGDQLPGETGDEGGDQLPGETGDEGGDQLPGDIGDDPQDEPADDSKDEEDAKDEEPAKLTKDGGLTRDGDTESERKITIGIIDHQYNALSVDDWKIHFWSDGISAADANIIYLGTTETRLLGYYWNNNPQTFHMFEAYIPENAQFKVYNGNTWFGGDAAATDNCAYLFEYSQSYYALYQVPSPNEYYTVYFDSDWENVKVHYWGDGWGTTFPGIEMTSEDHNICSANIPCNATGMLFAVSDQQQTANIENGITDGATWHITNEQDGGGHYIPLSGMRSVTVTFDAVGGTPAPEKQTIAKGQKAIKPADPQKDEYRFTQWNLNGSAFDFTEPVWSDVTLVAEYAQLYTVTVSGIEHGTVTPDKAQAVEGDTVTLMVTPEEGYQVSEVKVNGEVIESNNGVYPFTMPAANVTVNATFEPIPSTAPTLPTATATQSASPAKGVAVYSNFAAIANGQPTGQTVDLGVEYTFTADDVPDEQYDYYKDWNCDYRITFTGAIDANTFGLYGKKNDLKGAFVFPYPITDGQQIYLLSSLGQPQTYKDIKELGTFVCGAFNLSEDNRNQDKKMTVELVIWQGDDQTTAEVIASRTYTFDDLTVIVPPKPTADVSSASVSGPLPLYDTSLQQVGTVDKLQAAYLFKVKASEDDAVANAQYDYYKDWRADYRVTFNDGFDKESFGLYGQYSAQWSTSSSPETYSVAFRNPENISANTAICLVSDVLGHEVTYGDIIDQNIQFTCGVFNLNPLNANKFMKVELVLWDPKVSGTPTENDVLHTETYTFPAETSTITLNAELPDYPEVNVTDVEEPGKAMIDGVAYPIEKEYIFTFKEGEPTEAQLAAYGEDPCDYFITFDQDVPAKSIGFYGKYGENGEQERAFLNPDPIAKGKTIPLIRTLLPELLGDENADYLTLAFVANTVKAFDCGIFNLSQENLNSGLKVTVSLESWTKGTEHTTDTAHVYASREYKPATPICIVQTTSKDTRGNEVIATLTGGGQYPSGTTVTVKAPNDVTGYTFLGWYKGSYANENKVADTYAHSFDVTEDVNLIAVYANNAALGQLYVEGSTYTVNGGDKQTGPNHFDIPVGDKVTLAYSGDGFLYWVNASNNIVSTGSTYNFTMVGETTIKLITSTDQVGPSVNVVFLNAYSQVLSKGSAIDEEEVEAIIPSNTPSKIGATFEKWVFEGTEEKATVAAIFAKAAKPAPVVKVVPFYTTSVGDVYTLTVKYKNGDTVDSVEGYTGLQIKAGTKKVIQLSSIVAAVEGLSADEFSYWSLDGTNAISYNKTQFTALATAGKDITLTAVFDGPKTPEPIVTILQMTASMNGEKYRVSTMMMYEVPEGCTVLESGFVRSTTEDEFTEEQLVIGAPNTKKHITRFTDPSAMYTLNLNFSNRDKVVYYRAYIIYEKNGELITQYSSMVSGSYSTIVDP